MTGAVRHTCAKPESTGSPWGRVGLSFQLLYVDGFLVTLCELIYIAPQELTLRMVHGGLSVPFLREWKIHMNYWVNHVYV